MIMMPSSAVLPAGVDKEALLTELRRLSWGTADILRAYARGEQPPHGFPKALSVMKAERALCLPLIWP